MSQPQWKLVANIGDVSPEHGACYVFVDETGVYDPEAELIEAHEDCNLWLVRRFVLEDCTFENGILSDNRYHPDYPAWFADDLGRVADFIGSKVDELVKQFLSDNPVDRARAWRSIGDYHGFDNLDSYPLEFHTEEDLLERYDDPKYQDS